MPLGLDRAGDAKASQDLASGDKDGQGFADLDGEGRPTVGVTSTRSRWPAMARMASTSSGDPVSASGDQASRRCAQPGTERDTNGPERQRCNFADLSLLRRFIRR